MKNLILLFVLISLLSCNTSINDKRFVYIDYNEVMQDLKEKGKASEYYKKLNYEAMICLDTNSMSTFRKINPDFMKQNNLDSTFMVRIDFINRNWEREMHVDFESLKVIFTDEEVINRMCSYVNKNGVNYNSIDSTIYIKDDKRAYFTHHYSDGFETFRISLDGRQLKIQLVSEKNK